MLNPGFVLDGEGRKMGKSIGNVNQNTEIWIN
ncbi:class I tRNA ligase family protein [Bacillus pacificus]